MHSILRWRFFTGLVAFAAAAAIALWARRPYESRPQSAAASKTIELSHSVGPWFVNYCDPTTNVVRHSFSFRNTTNDFLLLRLQYASCGCVETGIDPPKVAPGAEARVSLTFDTLYRPGRRTEFVEIATGNNTVPIVRCRLTVSVFPSIVVLPYGRKLETTVDAGKTVARDFTVVTYSSLDHQSDRLTWEVPAGLAIYVDKPTVVVRGDVVERKYPCHMRIGHCELPTFGNFHRRVVWRSGNNEFFTDVNIRIAPVVAVQPPQMFVAAGSSMLQEIRIRLSAKRHFRITEVENNATGIRVTFPNSSLPEKKKQKMHEFVVSFTPRLAGESKQAMSANKRTVLFHTDLEDCPIVPFTVWVLQD